MDGMSDRAVKIRRAAAKLEAIPTPDFGTLEGVIDDIRAGLDQLAEMIEQMREQDGAPVKCTCRTEYIVSNERVVGGSHVVEPDCPVHGGLQAR